MKYLIAGSGGQLGREWIVRLEQLHADAVFPSKEDFDITDPAKVNEQLLYHRPDVVINCAAYTRVDDAEDNKHTARQVNEEGVRHLAEICKTMGILLVHYSTDYVFEGSTLDASRLKDGYPEYHAPNPVNYYGITKLKGERIIQESGVEYLIIRVSWLCGQFGNNFVKTMVRLGEQRDTLNVVNDQWGSPAFAHNVVENTLVLIRHEQRGVFHITSSGKTNWSEFARLIFSEFGLSTTVQGIPSSEYPTRAVRPAFSLLSTKKISTIPDHNILPWQQGLRELIRHIRA
ncbi:MAG: dTDP-4-dehydrorhamnose reductase [Bacteroidota bacterium]